jgi:hypothetical protein
MIVPNNLDYAGTTALARVGSVTTPAAVYNNGGNRSFEITNNITTTDPDPRELGAQLGWEIANRVG